VDHMYYNLYGNIHVEFILKFRGKFTSI